MRVWRNIANAIKSWLTPFSTKWARMMLIVLQKILNVPHGVDHRIILQFSFNLYVILLFKSKVWLLIPFFFEITKNQICAKAFTILEDSYCKGRYNSKYEDLDKALKLCEGDARCFGVEDNNYGQDNTNGDESKRYQRCTVDDNKERYTSSRKRAIYVKGMLQIWNHLFWLVK